MLTRYSPDNNPKPTRKLNLLNPDPNPNLDPIPKPKRNKS